MAGQTINDRLLAAKHSLAGQGLAKSVCKATTEELLGPKKKHLDCKYISFYSNIKLFSVLNKLCNEAVSIYGNSLKLPTKEFITKFLRLSKYQ